MINKTQGYNPSFKGCTIGRDDKERLQLAQILLKRADNQKIKDIFKTTIKETCDKINEMNGEDLYITWGPDENNEYKLSIKLRNKKDPSKLIGSRSILPECFWGNTLRDADITRITTALKSPIEWAKKYYSEPTKSVEDNIDNQAALELANYWA
ncbi:MAG: hypothetical protein IKU37_10340 [Candidatus Gastranaerophilales bacterium]|nr:hypothetical protein [Candidatus Gastranaerophilales bacterium]